MTLPTSLNRRADFHKTQTEKKCQKRNKKKKKKGKGETLHEILAELIPSAGLAVFRLSESALTHFFFNLFNFFLLLWLWNLIRIGIRSNASSSSVRPSRLVAHSWKRNDQTNKDANRFANRSAWF